MSQQRRWGERNTELRGNPASPNLSIPIEFGDWLVGQLDDGAGCDEWRSWLASTIAKRMGRPDTREGENK